MANPCTTENVDIDSMMLTMRRRMVPLDDILDSVPKPPNTVPRNGLPLWDHMPLDHKLSMPQAAYGKVVFARGKLGEDLTKPSADKKLKPEFNLSALTGPLLEYDSLHDPHLRCYFARPPNLRHVQRAGLATEDGLAVCNLHQFNEHRARLHVWYMDAVKREMAVIDERARDSLNLTRAARDAARRRSAYVRGERLREQQKLVIEQQREQKIERERKLQENQAMIAERSKRVKEARKERLRAARIAGLARTEMLNARVQAGVEVDVRRRLRAARAARQDGARRARNARRKREQRIREKAEKSDEAWKRRMTNEKNRLCLETHVALLREQDAEAGAACRAQRARAVHDQLEERLELECARRRTQLNENQIIVQSANVKAKANALARMAGERNDHQSLIERSRMRMDYDETTPAPVSSVLQDALGRAVATCARRRVFVLVRDLHLILLAQSLRFLDLAVPAYADISGTEFTKSGTRLRRSLLLTRSIVQEQVMANHSNPSGDSSDTITKRSNNGGKNSNSGNSNIGKISNCGNSNSGRNSNSEIISNSGRNSDIARNSDNARSSDILRKKLCCSTICCKNSSSEIISNNERISNNGFMETVVEGALPHELIERKKMLHMVNRVAKFLSRDVKAKVEAGIDLVLKKVTMPKLPRVQLEPFEHIDALTSLVLSERGRGGVERDAPELRHAACWLAREVLCQVRAHILESRYEEPAPVSSVLQDALGRAVATCARRRVFVLVRDLHLILLAQSLRFLDLAVPAYADISGTEFTKSGTRLRRSLLLTRSIVQEQVMANHSNPSGDSSDTITKRSNNGGKNSNSGNSNIGKISNCGNSNSGRNSNSEIISNSGRNSDIARNSDNARSSDILRKKLCCSTICCKNSSSEIISNNERISNNGFMETVVEGALPHELIERKKMLHMVNRVAKFLSRDVKAKVEAGIDLVLKKVTMPKLPRVQLEPFEHIDALTSLVLSERGRGGVERDAPELRHAACWLAREVLCQVRAHILESRYEEEILTDFYNPEPSNQNAKSGVCIC